MTNDLTDDGFHGSLNSGRVNRGSYIKWSDADHWLDRDDMTPPSPLLVIAIDEALQRWKDGKPDSIRDKPLPDPEALNSAIPESEWELGKDGKPVKPWARIVVVYLVDPQVGAIYTYSSPTIGARIAYDALNEAVFTMRVLRGEHCMPLVKLSERPFKTNFGMRRRPHFDIIGWKTPGNNDATKAIPPAPATPQLSGPTAPAAPSSPAPTNNTAQPYQAKPKPPVNLDGDTLTAMGDVKPVTHAEILDDELPW